MSEWWTYRLTSFLLFSPRTYYRLFELYNLAIWPAQLAGVAIGLAIVALLVRKRGASRSHHRRLAGRLLAVDRVGLSLPALCADQLGGAVVRGGVRAPGVASRGRRRHRRPNRLAARGRSRVPDRDLARRNRRSSGIRCWRRSRDVRGRTAETFGVAPDPTALATVAALALVRGRVRWLLLVVPLLWCAFTALTLWAMKSPEAIVVVAARAARAVAARIARRSQYPTAD